MNVIERYQINGDDVYTIEYRQQSDGTYKVYSLEDPPTRFGTISHLCHLHTNGEICVRVGREPRTLERAKAIALLWMTNYSNYCKTGCFPKHGKLNDDQRQRVRGQRSQNAAAALYQSSIPKTGANS